MRVRVRNKVYLKKNIDQDSYVLFNYHKTLQIIKIIIPNYKNVYGNIREYCLENLIVDDFDNYLYHFIAGPGQVIKIKEIKNGIWITRESRGVYYIYEPKSKAYRDQIEQESAEWLRT